MKVSGLTEKNMSNKRFKKTERAILIAYYKVLDCPNAKILAKKAGISRSTLHRHHQSVHGIPKDYENYLLQSYAQAMKKPLKDPNISLKILYLRTLVFISCHKELFKVLFREGRKDIIKRIIKKSKSKIIGSWRSRGNLEQVFSIYENEILGVFESWGKHGFPISRVNCILDEILYLTKTAPKHLAPITDSKNPKANQADPK